MKKLLLLVPFIFLFVFCEKPEEPDTTPPTVFISSPVSGQTVSESVLIEVITQDNEGINNVDFFIDDSLHFTDTDSSYQYNWNTSSCEDGSHIVKVISYDTSSNSTDSQPIMLIVDNTGSYPQAVNITSIDYTLDEMNIIWQQSPDEDFLSYSLLYAESEFIDKDTIAVYSEIATISHVLYDFDPTHENWFWISVSDTLGLTTISDDYVIIDLPPSPSELYPVIYVEDSFIISWSENQEDDFLCYTLFESLSPDMSNSEIIYQTFNIVDASTIIDIIPGQYRYYQLIVSDIWNQYSSSNIQQGISLDTWLIVNTTPSGASIYIDGSYTGETTPATITDITPGYHFVRIYKHGFNEIINYVYIEENIPYYITETLSMPIPPYPVIDIYSPYDGEHFVDNVIYVEGYIELDTGASFTGETAILSINGVDSEISIGYSGNFYETISIAAGENDLQVRANGPYGDTGVSSIVTVYGDFVAPEIEVVLWWNTPSADLDLHAWNPAGEHCYYGNSIISDGFLGIDDTEGFGPETFAVQTANLGIYTIQINSYSLDYDEYSDASVQIFFDGALIDSYGPHHFITDDYNGNDPEAWWEVCTIEVVNGRASITNKLPSEEIREKIAFDKTNLIEK